VTLAKGYKPYGEILASAGTGTSAYGFAGEWRDTNGLIYLRARYYSSAQGRFVQKDSWTGDYQRPLTLNKWNYSLSNPVNYTDPSGFAPCTIIGPHPRYCILSRGSFIDIDHFGGGRNQAAYLLQALPLLYGGRLADLPMKQGLLGENNFPYTVHYFTNLPTGGLSPDTLNGVALGIFLDFEVGYERAQTLDPRCYTLAFYINVGGFHCSAFSNEDLPSDYLGFVSQIKYPSIDDGSFQSMINDLGGGYASNEPPKGYLGQVTDPIPCRFGFCGDNTPLNNQCTLKIYGELSGKFVNVAWPASLDFKPIGFGIYWGRSPLDFASERNQIPVPTPPKSVGTPIPSPWR
jgi:RHS repeat-associated protein